MREAIRKHRISFENAFAGIFWALRTQPNFRVHYALSFLAIAAGLILGVGTVELSLLVFMIILGLSAEMINTSIEAMTDLITKEHHEDAKIAKDVSAGMMLTTAFGALIIAGIIFGPRIAVLVFRR